MQGNSKVPDHLLLVWSFSLTNTNREIIDVTDPSASNEHLTRPSYNTTNIPQNFLSNTDSVNETVLKIEHSLEAERNVSLAYESLQSLIMNEMDTYLPKK